LTPEHRSAGYGLFVSDDKQPYGYLNSVVTHAGRPIGQLKGRVLQDEGKVSLEFLKVNDEHQKRGLGVALNEALLSHAKHKRGLHTLAGEYHSTQASKTFAKLAQKHGLSYKPEPKIGRHSIHENEPIYSNMEQWSSAPSGAFDGKYAPFESTIKAEGYTEDELKKFHPTPTFPTLGVSDDRRETPIEPAYSNELATKQRMTAQASLATPQYKDLSHEEKKQHVRESIFNDNIQGAVSTDPNRRVGYVVGTPDSNRDLSTKLHEDFHQMMHRVEQKYGQHGRQLLARHLLRALDGGQKSFPIHNMYQLVAGSGSASPIENEEKVAHALNYLNDESYRKTANSRYYTHLAQASGINFHADRQREYHNALKRGYERMRQVAATISPKLLQNYSDYMTRMGKSASEEEFEELQKSTPEGYDNLFKPLFERWNRNGIESLDSLKRFRADRAKISGVPEDRLEWDKYSEAHPKFLEALHRAPITINLPAHRISDVAEFGRFKNLMETEPGAKHGAGMGNIHKPTRVEREAEVLGIPRDAPEHYRPIYGALHVLHDSPRYRHLGGADSYGEAWMVLKPHVRDRSTYTHADSFGVDPWHVHTWNNIDAVGHQKGLSSLHREVLRDHGVNPDNNRPYPYIDGYIESQIYGGVDLAKDVAEIHVPSSYYKASPELQQTLKHVSEAHGIPVYVHGKHIGDAQEHSSNKLCDYKCNGRIKVGPSPEPTTTEPTAPGSSAAPAHPPATP
jgi:GNAT superfamily N-acetyltransferase